jgi:hypothetical protein
MAGDRRPLVAGRIHGGGMGRFTTQVFQERRAEVMIHAVSGYNRAWHMNFGRLIGEATDDGQ